MNKKRYTLDKLELFYYDDLEIYLNKNKFKNDRKFVKSHLHNCYEIEFIISGSLDEIINDSVYHAVPGDLFLLSPNDMHELRNIDDAYICTIMFPETFIDEELLLQLEEKNLFFNIVSRMTEKTRNKLEFLISMIEDEIKNGDVNSKVSVKNILNIIITFILRNVVEETNISKKYNSVRKAVVYIKDNFKEQITLKEVADTVGLESKYFSVLFKKSMGLSYKDFLNEMRLNYAQRLLSENKESVTDICYLCGYGSVSNFNRMFKRKFALSPSEYRENKNMTRNDGAMVKNGSFEFGRNGWHFQGNIIDSSIASDGKKSLLLVKWHHLNQTIRVKKNTIYNLSFDFYNPNKGWASVEITSPDGRKSISSQLHEYGHNSWEKCVFMFSVEYGMANIDFYSGSDVNIWIDNVKIEEIKQTSV